MCKSLKEMDLSLKVHSRQEAPRASDYDTAVGKRVVFRSPSCP